MSNRVSQWVLQLSTVLVTPSGHMQLVRYVYVNECKGDHVRDHLNQTSVCFFRPCANCDLDVIFQSINTTAFIYLSLHKPRCWGKVNPYYLHEQFKWNPVWVKRGCISLVTCDCLTGLKLPSLVWFNSLCFNYFEEWRIGWISKHFSTFPSSLKIPSTLLLRWGETTWR